MPNKTKIVIIASAAAVVLIATGAGLYIYISKEKAGGAAGNLEVGPPAGKEVEPVTSNQLPVTSNQLPVTSNQLPVTSNQLKVYPNTYKNSDFGFSFQYPDNFNITEFEEREGYMILAEGVGANNSFQIYINVYDEEGPLSAERIKQDLPKLVMENPQIVILSVSEGSKDSSAPPQNDQDNGIPAVVFFSQDESKNKTREAWFVYPKDPSNGNNLFQVSSPAGFDAELSKIMATFTFSN